MALASKILGLFFISTSILVFLYYTSWTILIPIGFFDEYGLLLDNAWIFPPKKYATIIPAALLTAAITSVAMFMYITSRAQTKQKKKA